jgi:hypothetical protein
MTEAFEKVQRARGALYDLHQLIGIDVLEGRWTYQVVEEFDDGFYAAWKAWQHRVLAVTVDGERHAAEARMKAERQSPE